MWYSVTQCPTYGPIIAAIAGIINSTIKGTVQGTMGFDPRFFKRAVKSFYHTKMLLAVRDILDYEKTYFGPIFHYLLKIWWLKVGVAKAKNEFFSLVYLVTYSYLIDPKVVYSDSTH